ncbi:hypothetical protein PENSPDRAFT_685912 [Peniophora sp. CONT]|nr:hypothetical protein PENSPDRAFT_685912 [Peniophora sp. CONT]
MSRPRPTSMFYASSSAPKARPAMIEVFPEGSDGGLPPTSRIWEEGIKWHSGAYTAAWASPKLMVVYECIRTHVSHNNNNPLYDRGYYWRRALPSPPPAPDTYPQPSSLSAPSSPVGPALTRRLHSSSAPSSQAGIALSKAYATSSVPVFTPAVTDVYGAHTGPEESNSDDMRSVSSSPPSPANYQLQAEPALFAGEPRGGVAPYTQMSGSAQFGRGQGLGSEQYPPVQANYGYA